MTIKTDVQLARNIIETYFAATSVKIVTADVVKNICALIERLKHHISEIVETGTGGNYLTDLTNCYKLLLAEVWPSVQSNGTRTTRKLRLIVICCACI